MRRPISIARRHAPDTAPEGPGDDRGPAFHRRPWGLFLLVFLLALGEGSAAAQTAPVDRGNDAMAIVNGVVLTRREFQVVYRQAVDRHAREGRPVDEAHLVAVRRSVIQGMVEEELLFQESRRLGIAIAEVEVEKALAAAREDMGGDQAFTARLSRLGMDAIHFRRRLGRQLAVEQLLAREVGPSVAVSEDEIRRFYEANQARFRMTESVRLRHILVRRGEDGDSGDPGTARVRIETIKAQLEKGADFADVARRYSEEPAAEQAGDLGYVHRGQLLPPLEAAVFDLAPGEVSRILTSDVGFHLFKAIDRRPATTIPIEKARSEIRQELWQKKYEGALQRYLRRLRESAKIQAAQ